MRAFIAIDIPFNSKIGEMQDSIEGGVKKVERENMHITLKFLGEIEEKILPEIESIVEDCKVEEFTIKLHGIGFFPNERYVKVIWIGIEGYEPVERMARCIDEKLARMGFKRERSYVPHLTVARAKGPVNLKALEKFRDFDFGEISVEEVRIKKSTLTPKGPVYEDIAIIQL